MSHSRNNEIEDCTAAAYYHARQVWTSQISTEITEPDSNVLALYEASTGYNPADPSTDQGGIEQNVLSYLVNQGAPVGNGGRDKLLGYVETDIRNLNDIRRSIYECGVCYIGFDIPACLDTDDPPPVWDYNPKGDNSDTGGHAVILCGYDIDSFTLISWGQKYKMTNRFFTNFADEAYALLDNSWIAGTGKTPLGMTPHDLWLQMLAIRG